MANHILQMNRFNHINIAAAIITVALVWAFVADPLVTHFAKELESPHTDLFRSFNSFTIILIIAFVLYLRALYSYLLSDVKDNNK